MSTTDTAPTEVTCAASAFTGVLHSREVPLGGPRAMLVRRTLPQRERSLIGAWCFADHYGPQDVRGGPGMDVPPHPHTGLQTVSWLFSGEVEHRDSAGVHAMVRPGELNLMTAGAGICHSEVSTAATTVLHGVQLWVALPDSDRDTDRDFAHYVPSPRAVDGAVLRVFLGELDNGGADRQAPAVRHGIARVDGEIREGVLELLCIAGDDGRLAVELEIDGNVRTQNATEQRLEVPDDLIEIDRLDAKYLAAAERDEPQGQGR